MTGELLLALTGAYLLGAIPSAYIVARRVAGVDIRTVGDGNVGAKNVYEQVGKVPGLLVATLDIGKGALAVLWARWLTSSDDAAMLAGAACVIGHDWTIFLRFQGGQGMAAIVGVLLVLMPREALLGLAVVGVFLLLTRNWDLSCGIGFGLIPLLAWWYGRPPKQVLYPVVLLPVIGFKKFLDLPRARRARRGGT
jgi:glycerol-3-phosphate acyltransferase PlsY